MNPNTLTADGFFFTLHLIQSLGIEYNPAEVMGRLAEVANGSATVFHSDAEEMQEREQKTGTPVSDEERQWFAQMRRQADTEIAVIASRIMSEVTTGRMG